MQLSTTERSVCRRGARLQWAGLALGSLLLSACSSAGGEPAAADGLPRAPVDRSGATPAVPVSEPDPSEITLAFGGDVHFEGGLTGVPVNGGSTFGPMSRSLRDADLAMVNMESAITRRGQPAAKELEDAGNRFWFRSPPSALAVAARSGVDVVTVANNHGADYGAVGLRDTLAAGLRSDVAVVGAGASVAEAYTPYRTTVSGTDIAVFGADASFKESNDPTWVVSDGQGPGLASARPGDDTPLLDAVAKAAAADDLVVVYLHWGDEGNACATDSQQRLAASLSAAGADIIVGSHAHVPLGAGLLGDTYVAYGLGNFFWYHGNQPDTGVLELTVRGDEVVADHWVPGVIRDGGGNPQPLAGRARGAAESDWRDLRACTDLAPGPSAAAEAEASPDSPDAADAPDSTASADGLPAFASSARRIGSGLSARMTAHDPDRCPVPLSDLRHLTLAYVGFDGQVHDGVMVVAADVAADVTGVFRALYDARFPIERMQLVDDYGGDDNASMAANNTSAYNCRRIAGSTAWSDHAYGRALDINPVQNPYVRGQTVQPPAGRPYVDVARGAAATPDPGVITEGDVVRRTFARLGWAWGGRYTDPDYQHFSAP